jgi:predicted MPP superfamily phosphohydrolase
MPRPVTPERYAVSLVLFHAAVLAASWYLAARWSDPVRCRISTRSWLTSLSRDVGALTLFTCMVAFAAPLAVNYDHARARQVGEISGRLMGQALFGEGIVLSAFLAYQHGRAVRSGRAYALTAVSVALFGMYVQAYRLEPRQLHVRTHELAWRRDGEGAARLRILHVTDIQTPVIGAREERALRTGLSHRPDLIVLTGDYVQDALGRPTEERAAHDLRNLVARIDFSAPLGVFATEGDVGPPCRAVFAKTQVRCLTDESAIVALPSGRTLQITGLSRLRGRTRDPALLAGLLNRGPRGDHRLVISHSPDFVDALPEPVDLVLAGHTHGGQFVLPLYGPIVTASRLPRRFAADLHHYHGTPVHVSRGVGMERGFAPPVRFLCPPEICVLDVRWP